MMMMRISKDIKDQIKAATVPSKQRLVSSKPYILLFSFASEYPYLDCPNDISINLSAND